MNTTRSRLAALAAAAGYPPHLLEHIQTATFPAHAGGPLTDPQVRQLAEAVHVLASNAYTADTVRILPHHYQQQPGDRWRERFWTSALGIANARDRHPQLHAPTERAARAASSS